jgi:hypothetical protein
LDALQRSPSQRFNARADANWTSVIGESKRVLAWRRALRRAAQDEDDPEAPWNRGRGTLTEVLVDEGDTVSPDQPLTRLDAAAQQAFVRQAAAGLDAALGAAGRALLKLPRAFDLGSLPGDGWAAEVALGPGFGRAEGVVRLITAARGLEAPPPR